MKKKKSIVGFAVLLGLPFFVGTSWLAKEKVFSILAFLEERGREFHQPLGEFSPAQLKKAREMFPKEISTLPSEAEKVTRVKNFILEKGSFEETQKAFAPLLTAKCCDESGKIYAALFQVFAKLAGLESTIEQGKGTCFFNTVKVDNHWYCMDLNEYVGEKEKGGEAAEKAEHFVSLEGYTKFCLEYTDLDISRDEQLVDYFPNYDRMQRHEWLKKNSSLNYSEVMAAKEVLPQVISGEEDEYQKVMKIRDYLAYETEYARDEQKMECLLKERRGNCEAFSRAFYALATLVGVEATLEYGNQHVFNAVRVNGRWYCMDVCWYAVPEVVDSSGNHLNVQMKEYSLASYETFLRIDQRDAHQVLKFEAYLDGAKCTLYNKSERYQWLLENCVHHDLEGS